MSTFFTVIGVIGITIVLALDEELLETDEPDERLAVLKEVSDLKVTLYSEVYFLMFGATSGRLIVILISLFITLLLVSLSCFMSRSC